MSKQIYLDDGTEAELVATLENGVNLVRRMVEVDYGESSDFYPSEFIEEAAHIHDKPPRNKYDSEVVRLRGLVDATKKEESEIRERVSNYKAEQAELLQRAELNDAVKYVFDFLDGKITHFLIKSYRDYSIKTLAEALDDKDSWKRVFRLLTLSGTPSGTDVKWVINSYRDGSGNDQQATPYRNHEDALRDLQIGVLEEAEKLAKSGKYDEYGVKSCEAAAEKYEFELPPEFVEMSAKGKAARKADRIASLKKQLEDEEATA